jgi:nucleotide-binding universal stress UspA family protein
MLLPASPGACTSSADRDTAAHLAGPRRIGVLVEGHADRDALMIRHAAAVASALGAPLIIARVVDPPPAGTPTDPIDWHLRALEIRAELERLRAEVARTPLEIQTDVVEACGPGHIRRWASAQGLDLLVTGASDDDREGPAEGPHPLMADGTVSLLIVCGDRPAADAPLYGRLLVPLDGSARAETALPLAIQLARAHNAELLLVHAVPPLELIEVGPPSSEDLDLRQRVRHRNEQVARAYLERVRARAADAGQPVRCVLVGDGDVRRHLADVIQQEHVDLVVLSAHGRGAADGPYGSVAAYLVARRIVPVLVRQDVPGRPRLLTLGSPLVETAPRRSNGHL